MKQPIGFKMTLDDETMKKNRTRKKPENYEVTYLKLSESQKKIVEVCDSMKDLLLYKNQKYGDSALNPEPIFYKGNATNSILIRLNDKIGRIKNNTEELPRVNDVCDIIGYCTLLLVSMEVSKHEIGLLKD